MTGRSHRRQIGGALGTIVLLIVIGFVGYWVYKNVLLPDAPPSCKELQNDCLRICRRTTSEAPDYQACERRCQQQAAACQSK